jgi:hypothetical protein
MSVERIAYEPRPGCPTRGGGPYASGGQRASNAGTYSVPGALGLFPQHAISGIVTDLVQGPKDCDQHGSEPNQSRGIQARSHLKEESAGTHVNLATSPRHAPDVGRTGDRRAF